MDARLAYEPDRLGEEPLWRPEWQDHAACAAMSVEVFFDESAEGVAEAKAVCAGCCAWEHCLDYALSDSTLEGVWGGMTYEERRELLAGREPVDRNRQSRASGLRARPERRQSRPRDVKPCGTVAAYARHRRDGEPACDACLEAQRAKGRENNRKRRQRAQDAA